MENLILASEICERIDSGTKVYISFDNCYSSHVISKSRDFLSLLHSEEAYSKKKIFFEKKDFKPNYFCAINNRTVTL